MNAVISLVHFCEAHGPTVVLCTQTTHKDLPPWSLINFNLHSKRNSTSSNEINERSFSHGLNDYKEGLSYSSSMSFAPPSLFNTNLTSSLHETSLIDSRLNSNRLSHHSSYSNLESNMKNNEVSSTRISNPRTENSPILANKPLHNPTTSHCNGCTPNFPIPENEINLNNSNRGYKSKDTVEGLIYTTTRYPSHPRLYAALRQACVRSLSCEFCPGREGPVLFGNEKHGYTLSYMFKIRDDRARGSQRFYAISILMMDRLYLIASSSFIIGKFRSLARFLQARSNLIAKPDNERKNKAQSLFLQNNTSLPMISSSPKTNLNINASNRSHTAEPKSDLIANDHFLRRRSNTQKTMRTLEDLLDLKYLTAILHGSFALILSAGAKRLNESKQTSWQKWIEPTTVLVDVLPVSNKDRYDTRTSSPGSSISSSSISTQPKIDHLGQLYHALGRVQFGKLMFNLVIGNQIVIRSSSKTVVKDIINVLQDILPLLCIRKSLYESSYQHIWISNILGLQRGVSIPDNIDLSSLVLLEIDIPSYGSKDSLMSLGGLDMIASLNYGIDEPTETNLPFPSFVNEILSIAQQSDSVFGLSPKDPSPIFDYNSLGIPISKTALSYFTGHGYVPLRLTSQEVRLKLIAVKESWSCKARMFAQFMRNFQNLSKNDSLDPEVKLPEFLKLLKVNNIDLPILRFFATAFRPRPVLGK